ncbi:MAG TPA: ABC transporter permease [Candidatus Limnocylindrales bacterium]|jgi:osmoprotectant transport system permease protein
MDIVNQTVAWLTDPAHWSGPNGIPVRLTEHIAISAVSLLIALAIALPIGLYIGHTGKHTTFAVNSANLWRALPSLAVIAIVLPITARIDPDAGFKIYPTIVAMVVLAVPPIMVNTYSGLAGVDRDMLEAGRGQGMNERQILNGVELPLAVPVIATGTRSAAIQVVATATLGAVFGFGGLGRYLVNGISQNDKGQIFGGVVLVAGLVLVTELGFAIAQHFLTPRGLRLENRSATAN